jgi:23S rRNA-/tRNA-specific pseudouridylate synthase
MQIDANDSLSIPVAKVLLQPWTGRRHQLRVHLAQVAGFPILGDVTYGDDITIKGRDDSQSEIVGGSECPAEGTRMACRRMCLHAKQLSILLTEGNLKTFEAPDPFTVVRRPGCEKETLAVY